MEVLRKISKCGTPYRIVDDGNKHFNIHIYGIEYAKTFNNEGSIIYGWYPLFEPQKTFKDWDEVKTIFDRQIETDEM